MLSFLQLSSFSPVKSKSVTFLAFSYLKQRVSPKYYAKVTTFQAKHQTAVGLYTKFSGSAYYKRSVFVQILQYISALFGVTIAS